MGVAYQAGPVRRSPFGVNGEGSSEPSSSTHSLPTFTRDRSPWDRSTSQEPGSFASNAGALTHADDKTLAALAAAGTVTAADALAILRHRRAWAGLVSALARHPGQVEAAIAKPA